MRHIKQLCAAFVLILAISLSAFAGDMETTITSPPPPGTPSAPAQGEMEAGYAGDMETTRSSTTTGSVTGIALALVQSVLALV